MYPKTLGHARRIIKSKFPKLDIAKTPAGFFYFYSRDKKINDALLQLYTTAVYVYVASELSAGQWIQEASKIMEQLSSQFPT